jgi:tRNA modification GTPase
MGIDKSKEKIIQADIVIALFDVNTTSSEQIHIWEKEIGLDKIILVGNKMDLTTGDVLTNFNNFESIVFISAKDKNNIAALKHAITQKVVGDQLKKEGTIVTNARHVSSLKKLLLALNDIETGLLQNVTGDLLALDIRQALHYLGTITGEITSEDQLDFIFSKFCIGK